MEGETFGILKVIKLSDEYSSMQKHTRTVFVQCLKCHSTYEIRENTLLKAKDIRITCKMCQVKLKNEQKKSRNKIKLIDTKLYEETGLKALLLYLSGNNSRKKYCK